MKRYLYELQYHLDLLKKYMQGNGRSKIENQCLRKMFKEFSCHIKEIRKIERERMRDDDDSFEYDYPFSEIREILGPLFTLCMSIDCSPHIKSLFNSIEFYLSGVRQMSWSSPRPDSYEDRIYIKAHRENRKRKAKEEQLDKLKIDETLNPTELNQACVA